VTEENMTRTNDPELETWREQWNSVAEPPAEFQRKVQERIKLQDRRFVLGNILTAITFLGMLVFAFFMRHRSSWMGPGWATGICVLVLVAAGFRINSFRGTWRPQSQSTRAFVELWHKRVAARIRLLRISIYLSLGWIIFCAVLTAANWATIGLEAKAHPKAWVALLVVCVLMQYPMIRYGAGWLRRRKLEELNEVEKILDEMDGKNLP
jgi:Na+/melibiose symporter-like transporter